MNRTKQQEEESDMIEYPPIFKEWIEQAEAKGFEEGFKP